MDEAHKFKNQFRALDDDEIDFLDGVKAAQRAEEQRVRRETEQGLEAFRAAQEATAVVAADDDDDAELEDSWLGPAGGGGGARKRRRERERDKFKRVRRRESGPLQETSQDGGREEEHDAETAAGPAKAGISSGGGLGKGPAKGQNGKTPQELAPVPAPGAPVPVSKVKAGLVDYGSSDDDDD